MQKARVLLAVLIGGLCAGHWFVAMSGLPYGVRILLHMIGSILLLAAGGIFVFSFIEAEAGPDGSLRFSTKNPFMRLVLERYREEARPQRLTLCNAYWLTVMLIIVYAIIVLMAVSLLATAAGLVYAVATGRLAERWVEVAPDAGKAFLVIAVIVAASVPLGAGLALFDRAKRPRLVRPLQIGLALWVPSVFSLLMKVLDPKINIGWAFLATLAIVAYLAAFVGLIVAAFRCISALRGTWLGAVFGRAKDRFCPVVVISTADQEPTT